MEKVLAKRKHKQYNATLYYVSLILSFAFFVFLGVMCIVSGVKILFSSIMFVLALISIFPGCLIIARQKKTIEQLNSYPTDALVYRDGHLYIITDVEEEILVTTIVRIWDIKDTTNAGFYSLESSTGTLYIKTVEQTYKLKQIDNVTATAKYANEVLGLNK